MAANKTRENTVDVSAFVAKVADAGQRADADSLIKLLKRLAGAPPKMWGPSIIGFGAITIAMKVDAKARCVASVSRRAKARPFFT